MVDDLRGVWLWWAVFAGIFAVLIFGRMLPLGAQVGALPGPDLVMCLACAWVLRRPDYLPALLIAVIVLVEDMLLMRPPGLWAAIMLVGTEFLRHSRRIFARADDTGRMGDGGRRDAGDDAGLPDDRGAAAMLPQPALGLTLIQLLWSVAAYPAVVGASRLAFGLRKPATGEVDAMGRRL
jgi:rod shape-determining protein MreD